MLKPEQVPPDAMYAAWKAINAGMTLNDAIAAAINAWPGMQRRIHIEQAIILPLNTENGND